MGKVIDDFIFKSKHYTREEFNLLIDKDKPETPYNIGIYTSVSLFITNLHLDKPCTITINIDTNQIIMPPLPI